MILFRVDRRCWNWLGISNRVRITEMVNHYSFEAISLDVVASVWRSPSCVRYLEPAETFTLEQKRVLYSRHPNQVFIDDAIKEYRETQSFREAEAIFESMIRPFVNTFRPEHIKAVVDSATANSQIYCERNTDTTDVSLRPNAGSSLRHRTSWQAFLAHSCRCTTRMAQSTSNCGIG